MALIKGLNKNIVDLSFSGKYLSELYKGENLIWRKSGQSSSDSNMITADGFVLVSQDGLILIGK